MAAKHSYYAEDTPSRKLYFEKQFLILAARRARQLGQSLPTYLGDITNENQFHDKLLDASEGLDDSLHVYFSGMGNNDIAEFFERPKIQKIVAFNSKLEDASEEEKQAVLKTFPVKRKELPKKEVMQDKKRVELFSASRVEYSSGKLHRTLAKKDKVTINGNKIIVFRDSRGRFVKVAR